MYIRQDGFRRGGLGVRTGWGRLSGVETIQLSWECKLKESEIHTFKSIGITSPVNSFINMPVSSFTISGSTTSHLASTPLTTASHISGGLELCASDLESDSALTAV